MRILPIRFPAQAQPAMISNTYVTAPSEEINYAAGADLALGLRTTVAADVVGRIMRKAGTMTWGPADFAGSKFPQYQQFDFTENQDLQLLLGSAGLKVNTFGNMLFTANVLFPLTKNGLTDQSDLDGGRRLLVLTALVWLAFSSTDSIVQPPRSCFNLNTRGDETRGRARADLGLDRHSPGAGHDRGIASDGNLRRRESPSDTRAAAKSFS